MDASKLAARLRQPGHDRTFLQSEQDFLIAATNILHPLYEVRRNPRDLSDIFATPGNTAYGVIPEASVTSVTTGRKFFVEVKKQGPSGNAEERAARHHTVRFYEVLREKFRYNYHPYVLILCDRLADHPRYVNKYPFIYEPKQYFLWKDYCPNLLSQYLLERCAEWLED